MFSTTIAKVIRSPASTPVTLLLNVLPRLLEVTGRPAPLRREHAPPGAETAMFGGTFVVGVMVALGFLAAMMPLRIPSTGSNTCTWTMLSAIVVSRNVLPSCWRTWFVRKRASAKGSLVAVTVNRMSTTWVVFARLSQVPKSNFTELAFASAVTAGMMPEAAKSVSAGPQLSRLPSGVGWTALELQAGPLVPSTSGSPALKIGKGRKSVRANCSKSPITSVYVRR